MLNLLAADEALERFAWLRCGRAERRNQQRIRRPETPLRVECPQEPRASVERRAIGRLKRRLSFDRLLSTADADSDWVY